MNETVPSVVRSQSYPPFIRYTGYVQSSWAAGFASFDDPFYFWCKYDPQAAITSVTPQANDRWAVGITNCQVSSMGIARERYCSTPPPPGSGFTGQGIGTVSCPGDPQRVCPVASPAYTLDPGGLTCSRPARVNPKQLGSCQPKRTGTFLGNPIDCGSGNKFEREVDYAAQGSGGLRFERFYNSAAEPQTLAMGIRWRHNWMRSIEVTEPADGRVAVTRPDGKVLTFIPSGATWTPDADVADRLVRLTNPGNQHIGWDLFVAATEDVERYDSLGRLMFVMTRSGLVTTVTYDAVNVLLPVTVTDPFGRQLQFAYSGVRPRLASVTDPAGQIIRFRYGGNGASTAMLTEVEYPGALIRRYRYGNQAGESQNGVDFAPGGAVAAPYLLTGVIDERNTRIATFRYDAQNRAISTERAGAANRYQITWGTNESQRTVTDPLGVSRVYQFTLVAGMPGLTSVGAPACPSCGPAARTFDANGNLASTTDWNGFRTTYTFDLARNLETSRTEGLNANGTVRPETRTIQTTWHPTFRLPLTVTERNSANVALRETTMGYDVRGNLVSRSVKDVASNQTRAWTWTHTYSTTIQGLILQTVLDGPRLDLADTTTWTFDPANGNLLSKAERVNASLSLVTTYGNHDAHGNARTIIDPNGVATTLVFDTRQRLVSSTTGSEITAWQYDAAGLLSRITQPDNSRLDFTYDDAQRLVRIEDTPGNRIDYTLDAMGNRTREDVRDLGGNLRQTRARVYDTLNRLVQEVGAAGQVTAYTHDNQGNVLTIDGPLAGIGDTTTQVFDALNRMTRSTAPDGGQTQYAFNALDQLLSVTDPRNVVTSYTVNALDNVSAINSPDAGTTTRASFDAAGNILTERFAGGLARSFQYDGLNRMTRGGRSPNFYLYYDDGFTIAPATNTRGRLHAVADQYLRDQYTVFGYSPQGRVTSKLQGGWAGGWGQAPFPSLDAASKLLFAYDSGGRVLTMTYPSGMQIGYQYDSHGRVSRLLRNGVPLVTVTEWHPFGGPKRWVLDQAAGAPALERQYDLDGRVSRYRLGAEDFQVNYDLASRISSIASLTNPADVLTLGYDITGRLTSYVRGSVVQAFTYDLNGNRTQATRGSTTTNYTIAASSNRMVADPQPVTINAAGRLAANSRFTGVTHDGNGRLDSVQSVQGNYAFHYHNGLGERTYSAVASSTSPGVVTLSMYDLSGQLAVRYREATAQVPAGIVEEIVWLGSMPVASIRSGSVFYIHADHLDSPRRVTNTLNQPVWRWEQFDAFGDNVADENPSGLGVFEFVLRFPGQQFQAGWGVTYNYFRDYDSATGRYIQTDPIGLAGGVNTYDYVQSNPLSYADPDGLQKRGAEYWRMPGGARPGDLIPPRMPPIQREPENSARDAAAEIGSQRGRAFECRLWNCPKESLSCGVGDYRRPTDFMPTAVDMKNPPQGCACMAPGLGPLDYRVGPWNTYDQMGVVPKFGFSIPAAIPGRVR